MEAPEIELDITSQNHGGHERWVIVSSPFSLSSPGDLAVFSEVLRGVFSLTIRDGDINESIFDLEPVVARVIVRPAGENVLETVQNRRSGDVYLATPGAATPVAFIEVLQSLEAFFERVLEDNTIVLDENAVNSGDVEGAVGGIVGNDEEAIVVCVIDFADRPYDGSANDVNELDSDGDE